MLDLESELENQKIVITKRELLEQIVLRTDMRLRDVKDVVDACFDVTRQALLKGYDVQLPPLGRLRAVQREAESGSKMHYKLMLIKAPKIGG